MKYQLRRFSFLADLAHLAFDLAAWLWLLLGMVLLALGVWGWAWRLGR